MAAQGRYEEIEFVSQRRQRARNRYLRLVFLSSGDDDMAVQKFKNGEWRSSHVLETDENATVVDCSCPDRQSRGKERGLPCYHMLAWTDFTFDEVVYHDGTVCDVTDREKPG